MVWWQVVFAVAAGIVALGGAWKAISALAKALRKASRFVDAVAGTPGEYGREPEPGLIQKVDAILKTQEDHTQMIEKIHHEVFPNSSKSLRDVVDRIEKQLASAPPVQVNVNP